MAAGLLVALPMSLSRALSVLFLVLLLLCLEEFSQYGAPAREFSWGDLAMGLSGALSMLLGTVFWFVTITRK